jgi:hypothetical protein
MDTADVLEDFALEPVAPVAVDGSTGPAVRRAIDLVPWLDFPIGIIFFQLGVFTQTHH